MKLTVTFIGKNRRVRHSMSVRSIVSLTVLSSLFVLVSSRSTDSSFEDLARVKIAQNILEAEKQQVEALKSATGEQVKALTEQLSEMRLTLDKIDAKTQVLAKAMGIDEKSVQDFGLASVSVAKQLQEEQDRLLTPIEELGNQLLYKQQQLDALERLVTGHHIDEQISLSGRPIEKGWLSSYYGMRADPFTGQPAMHSGLDFAGEVGDDVVATAAGIVTWSGDRYGYGKLVEIEHGDGLVTRYGHNDSLLVNKGDLVTKGQVIAQMGSTGRSTGAHVHYEVIKSGQKVDPLPYVYNK
ncbi:M23 family metallopeptidase [Aestuariibacter sp. GS-14]|uniref:M23 family metallopeptidase n=1 Tax=Aestuariibacter sp. GS-14 TaxID=2590670 RepID=UPI00112990AD|nr:M23 family metallopeptidase [Aestuariibacter sp. GS-14]TPV56124.1 M23 family metallopeptidase [Aestuariibacter sp. GS-14]